MASLESHLGELVKTSARTLEWLTMELGPICREIERRVEAAHPDEEEGRISALCHKRVKKLGKALRLGWELELLELEESAGSAGKYPVGLDANLLLDRLDAMGPRKQAGYMLIKRGDRRGSAALSSTEAEDADAGLNTSVAAYGEAVAAVGKVMWHRNATDMCRNELRGCGAERVLDVGSSFNPFRNDFPQVTAIDAVPTQPDVLAGDFLEVELDEGLTAPRVDPSSPGNCLAIPAGFYDAAVLSLVLRSVPGVPQRHELVRRAARSLRVGGHLVIVEKGSLGILLKYRCRDAENALWQAVGLRRRVTRVGLRGVRVNVFERVK